MRNPGVIIINGTALSEILELHKSWLYGIEGTCANLTGADLTDADLTGANLTGANLTRADLTGADLACANLTRADLACAKYEIKGVKAKRFNVFNDLYRYCVIPIIDFDGNQYVKMGCKFQSRTEWENNFWNNKSEFPDDGSEKTELRKFALETAFRWLDLIANQIKKEQQ